MDLYLMITVYFHLKIEACFGASRADDATSKWSLSASKEMLKLQVYIEQLQFLNAGQMLVKLKWDGYSSQNESRSPGVLEPGRGQPSPDEPGKASFVQYLQIKASFFYKQD